MDKFARMLNLSNDAPGLNLPPHRTWMQYRLTRETSSRSALCRICTSPIMAKEERIMLYAPRRRQQAPNGGSYAGERFQMHIACVAGSLNLTEDVPARLFDRCVSCDVKIEDGQKRIMRIRGCHVLMFICPSCAELPAYEGCRGCDTVNLRSNLSAIVAIDGDLNPRALAVGDFICDECANSWFYDVISTRRQLQAKQRRARQLTRSIERAREQVSGWLVSRR